MKRGSIPNIIVSAAMVLLLASAALAESITLEDMQAEAEFQVQVASPADPGLVGFFESVPGCMEFSCALLEEGEGYRLFIKPLKTKGFWAGGVVDGREIKFGKDGFGIIWLEEDGTVHMTNKKLKGKTVDLVRVDPPAGL